MKQSVSSARLWSSILAVVSMAAGCSGSNSAQTVSSDLIGTWNTTAVACNGSAIAYIPQSGLYFQFTATNLIQTKQIPGCTQATTLSYTYDGTNIVVPAGSSVAIACTPASCTGTGLVSAAACGTTSTNVSTATLTVTSLTGGSGGIMNLRETDAQGSSICTSFGGTIPLTFVMTKY